MNAHPRTNLNTIGQAVTELQQDKFVTHLRLHVLLLPLICNVTGFIHC